MLMLGAVRLSRHRGEEDPSTSPERQVEVIETQAASDGDEIVDWAMDLDESAITKTPFERTELSKWLSTSPPKKFGGIIFARMDRAVRSMADLTELCRWAGDNRKMLVICGTAGQVLRLDFRNGPLDPVTTLIITILAFAAEMEGRAIRERNAGTKAFMRSAGRWGGGMYPYHTEPVKQGKEWRLSLNPQTAPIVSEIIDRVIHGDSRLSIAMDLNARKVPSPREHRLLQSGRYSKAPVDGEVVALTKPTTGPSEKNRKVVPGVVLIRPSDGSTDIEVKTVPAQAEFTVEIGQTVKKGERLTKPILWNVNTLTNLLQARALLGETELDKKPFLGEDGLPIKRVEALISRDKWTRLQKTLADASRSSGVPRTRNASLLLNIAFCARCGEKLYLRTMKQQGGEFVYYGCRSNWGYLKRQTKAERCPETAFRADELEGGVTEAVLAQIGDHEIQELVKISGESHEDELSEALESLTYVAGLASRAKTPKVRELYESQIAGLEARIEVLATLPTTEDHYELRGTGTTYADAWEDSPDTRHWLLQNAGIAVFATHDETVRHEGPDRSLYLRGNQTGIHLWVDWSSESNSLTQQVLGTEN